MDESTFAAALVALIRQIAREEIAAAIMQIDSDLAADLATIGIVLPPGEWPAPTTITIDGKPIAEVMWPTLPPTASSAET